MEEVFRKRFVNLIEQNFRESIQAKEALCRTGKEVILAMAEVIGHAFRSNHRLFIFGNGGSAADAQHIAAELVNRFEKERPPLPAIALTVDTSILTSISNDYDFKDVFLKQLQALAQPDDVALGISTSGRSANVVEALGWAREHGLHTVGWAGAAVTEMDSHCDIILHVFSQSTARVQECHITVGHVICGLVEEMLYEEEVPIPA